MKSQDESEWIEQDLRSKIKYNPTNSLDILNLDPNKIIEKPSLKIFGSTPDIDIDLHAEEQEKVVQYCAEKYEK